MCDEATVRVAVAGCGGWTQVFHLPDLARNPNVIIAALIDPSDKPGVGGCMPSQCMDMDSLCAKYGARRYRSIEEALAEDTHLNLDGVIVATSHRYHATVGRAVMEAGKHLLIEKPMTTDVTEARELYDMSCRSEPKKAFLINNTANWREGTQATFEAVSNGVLGEIRHVSCVFASPLGWLFEGADHSAWTKPSGSMKGNGFGWGQFSHTFAWVFKVTGLTPAKVYCVSSFSETTGADVYNAVVISCTNGCTINASGVGNCPNQGFKVAGNWIFGTKGMLSYSGLGADNADGMPPAHSNLEIWTNDGKHTTGPEFEFEMVQQGTRGSGGLAAFLKACRGQEYFSGSGAAEGLKAVGAIDAMYRSALSGLPESVLGCEGL